MGRSGKLLSRAPRAARGVGRGVSDKYGVGTRRVRSFRGRGGCSHERRAPRGQVTKKSFNFAAKRNLPFSFVSASEGTNVVKARAPAPRPLALPPALGSGGAAAAHASDGRLACLTLRCLLHFHSAPSA